MSALLAYAAKNRQALARVARRIVRDESTAQDCVQEAILRALPHRDEVFACDAAVAAWMRRTVHNVALDYVRVHQRRRQLLADCIRTAPSSLLALLSSR